MSELRTLTEKLFDKVFYSPDGCWYWTASTCGKYGRLVIDEKNIKAHRLSFELHKGPITDGMHVCHSCDNPLCVNPDHLYLGTHQDNMKDRNSKGRQARLHGVMSGQAKLDNTSVQIIREAKRDGWRSKDIAKYFGISKGQIWNICKGGQWPHIV